MKEIHELEQAVKDALELLKTQPDIQDAQVFISANGRLWTRLNYTSHIPSNALEEPKSTEDFGIGIQAVFKTDAGLKVGFGSEERDISVIGVKLALEKAREGAITDAEFHSLPRPGSEERKLFNYHDSQIMQISDEKLVDVGWEMLDGAISTFNNSTELVSINPEISKLGLIVGGDVTILQEKMAVGSYHIPVQSDESALLLSSITAMVEAAEAKGSGYSVHLKMDDFTNDAAREAAQNAIASTKGIRIPSGDYTVILGPQPTSEIFRLVLDACQASAFYSQQSPFLGKLGQKIAADMLTIVDKGNVPGLIGSKGITGEGFPTGETVIIKDGTLVGLLSDWYETQRILNDPQAKEKLGVNPKEWQKALMPRNGFRYSRGGGRNFGISPRTSATNVLFDGSLTGDFEELIGQVKDGILIGRLWYLYPVHGLKAGDFTGTITADSYLIKDGKISTPVKINTLRISDNIERLLMNIKGISHQIKPTVIWAADEIIYAPKGILVEGVPLEQIAEFMESV